MKRFFFKLFIWLFLIGGILFAGLIGIAAFYEEGVGTLLVNELKKTLKTDFEVESAELSLIWNFPNASITLKNIKLKGFGKDKGKLLLRADNISLRCTILGLITGRYSFDKIEFNNANIFAHVDKTGKANYDIFKSEQEQQETSKLDLSIKNAIFRNVGLEYQDERVRQNIQIKIINSSFSGNFTDDRYDMDTKASIISQQIGIGDDVYFRGKELGFDAIIDIDNKSNTFTFKKFEFNAEGNKFNTEGKIVFVKGGMNLDIGLKSDKAKLGPLLKLLPKSFEANLGGFQSDANMNFNASFNGLYSANTVPKTNISFALNEGKVTHPLMAAYLKSVSFDVNYEHKGGANKKDGILKLNNFKGSLSGNPIDLELNISGTENPLIDLSFNGKVPLKAIYGFFGKQVSSGRGNLAIENLILKGNLDDIINPRKISRVELGGSINFEDAKIVMNDIPLIFEQGNVDLKDNVLAVKDLIFKSSITDLKVNGNFNNLLPVIFADSTNSRNAELKFELAMISDKIDADELLKAFSSPIEIPKESEKSDEQLKDSIMTAKNEKREFITQFFNGNIIAECKEINYGKIKANNFKGQLLFENNVMKVLGVKANVFRGTVGLNAKIVFEKEPYMLGFFDCNNVDMYELLDKSNNFGQTTLTAQNLRGQLTSLVKIDAYWDAVGNFDYDKLYVVADITLKKGELIDFELMKSMGAYVKLKDLERIKFNEIKNQLLIKNNTLQIPAMFIQSNAINLTLAGKHGFNQEFDYKFKINAGQVIAQKMKKHNPKLPMVPAKKKGIFNIYLTVNGNVEKEEYNFKMGKKYAKKELQTDFNRQSNLVGNTLKAEFEKSDLFIGQNALVKAETYTTKISRNEEPEDWADTDNDDELENIEGF